MWNMKMWLKNGCTSLKFMQALFCFVLWMLCLSLECRLTACRILMSVKFNIFVMYVLYGELLMKSNINKRLVITIIYTVLITSKMRVPSYNVTNNYDFKKFTKLNQRNNHKCVLNVHSAKKITFTKNVMFITNFENVYMK